MNWAIYRRESTKFLGLNWWRDLSSISNRSSGSFVTNKENPNDFDTWYESFGLDLEILDPLFLEDVQSQITVFGVNLPSYEGFFRTDREGRPKGVQSKIYPPH
jgi:hypothetical protein